MMNKTIITKDENEFVEYENGKTENEIVDSENQPLPYTYIEPQKLKEGEKPLGNVIGHEKAKKELLLMVDWFNKSKELKEKGITIPKGALLFGKPGNGKTMLIREIIKYANAPVFIFNEGGLSIPQSISLTFKKAREKGKAIIVFDELDLLIDKSNRVVRALQDNLDGVENDGDIFILAATNDYSRLPTPLLRNGRIEKLIYIAEPENDDIITLFKKFAKDLNLSLPEDIEEGAISLLLDGLSSSTIKAIVNDIALRNGLENITSQMIDESIYNISDKITDRSNKDYYQVAVHEAGHALLAKKYQKYFDIKRLSIANVYGFVSVREVDENMWNYEKVMADIEISMAGILSEKIILGTGSRGCEIDLERARKDAYNLVNKCGFYSCWETLPNVDGGALYTRQETQIKRRKMELKIEKILRKCEKRTVSYLKKNKEKLIKLSKLLFEKKKLKLSEVDEIVGGK